MKNILYLLLLFLLLSIVVTILIVAFSNFRVWKLCNLIENGESQKAIEISNGMKNVNKYTSPLFTRNIQAVLGKHVKLPLTEACIHGDYDVVLALLNNNADPNKYYDGYFTPIEATFSQNNNKDSRLKILESLIESGAKVDLQGSGRSALFMELYHVIYSKELSNNEIDNEKKIISLLLNAGASPIDDNGDTVIHYLAGNKNSSLLSYVTEKYKYSINTTNNKGETPLMWAVSRGSINNVKYLLNNGALVDIVDTSGKTALDYAIESGNEEIIALLSN